MNRLIALWRKETLALLRDRHGLAALFVMPVIFILVMTMALHDAFMPGAAIDVGYAIVDLDGSPHSQSLVRRLNKTGSFRHVATVAQADTARQAIRDGRAGAWLSGKAYKAARRMATLKNRGVSEETWEILDARRRQKKFRRTHHLQWR